VRAVVLTGERSVAVHDVDDARLPGPDGVLVTVERTAICGSDLHLYHGDIPATGVHLGHEFIGTVAEAGADVRRLAVGDRVLVSGVIGCGRCRACVAGDPALCANGAMSVFGTTPELPGGQAEAVGVPWADTFARRIPVGIDDDHALLLTDILPTGFLAAERADIRPGATVVVIGLGPVGVLALQCAQLFGPARVFALDTVADRLERAAGLGAEPIDASGGAGVAGLLERTGGRGADAVIEAVGQDETIVDAIGCAAPGGTVSIVGVSVNMALPLPVAAALFKKLTIRWTVAAIPATWDALLALLSSGRLRPEGIFTHRLGLSQAAEAYRIFDRHEDRVLKVVLDPGA
jgi:2-desacetyl-2-hydroxyethyl bacteriochlorophyllide A dehydrogenase